ncbi:MAG: M67 family metallopeptidase [Alphaproteobacteria bacterium]|nr:M67 family metallopeptidase [Alphaproteobacteria bacterium]
MSSLLDRDVAESGTTLAIEPAVRAELEAHAVEGHPHEIVGILAGDRAAGRITAITRLQNTNTDRAADRYQVSPLALMKAEQALEARGLEIVGYYHSHPDHPAMYSDTDRDLALPNMAYLILGVQGHEGPPRVTELRCWRLRDDRSAMDEDALLLP